ncbi:hypothetical protein [Nocardia terpenica]|uniref:hypothetical protein n=1 Tax=Nocardia terpenica TaxID=455432 RepID=UPI000AD9B623|nr:hypothetical protein [Nocardia terpenica]NQE89551.1 hypothetical protein [Nocardia terpenica]
MPDDGYSRDRKPFDSNQRGRIFENGTYRYFRDWEKGYVPGSRIYEAEKERIRFDKVKEDRGLVYTIEDKSGRIGGTKDENQLKAIRTLIERGEVQHHLLRSVEGEAVSKEAQALIEALARDHPDKFTHQVITRDQAREIWARGLEMERGQQLELPGVGELARQQKAQQRDTPQQARTAEERARVEREAAERVAREFTPPSQQPRGREIADERAAQESQQLQQAQLARVAHEQAVRAMLPHAPEVADLLARSFLTPDEVLRNGPAPHDGTTRAGREARAQALERGIGRTR